MKFDIRIEQISHPDLSCFFIWFQRPRYAGPHSQNVNSPLCPGDALRWLIHIINSVDKTKLSCNTPTDAAPQFL